MCSLHCISTANIDFAYELFNNSRYLRLPQRLPALRGALTCQEPS